MLSMWLHASVNAMADVSLRKSSPTIAGIGEFGLIDRVTSTLAQGEQVLLGVGDDAAVIAPRGALAISTDVLVEKVHFRTDWSSAAHVGAKSIAVNVADIEGMGARPLAAVLGFSAPADTEVAWVEEFMAAAAAEAELAGVSIVGGDTTGSRDITVCVTVLGDTDDVGFVTRSGAVPGQVIAMTGRLGWAAGGLVVLSRGFASPRELVAAQQRPQVPYGQGRVAARAGATAMIDVSDGLLADLGHIADASGVHLDVDSSAFEVPEALRRLEAATGVDALGLVLTGGEDHALAACFSPSDIPDGWRRIGTVSAGAGVTVDGEEWSGKTGWDHFG